MRFFVSRRFLRHEDIRRMGERYFNLLPPWVQAASCANSVLVIAPSSQDAENVSKRVKLRQQEKLLKFVFEGNIHGGYVDFFGQLIKKAVHSDSSLNQVFLGYARPIMIDGISNQDIVDTLFRHLAWYFLNRSELYRYNRERFRFCEQIAASLLCISTRQCVLQ